MSPPPASRQKQQVMLLSGIVGMAVLYALYAFAWSPHQARLATREQEVLKLKGQIEKARKDLKQEPAVREEINRVTADLDAVRRTHVLQPVAGSSPVLEVQSRLFALARTSGFEIDNVSEVAIRPIPRRLEAKKPAAAKPAPTPAPAAAGAPAARPAKPPEPEPPVPTSVQVFVAEVGGVAGYEGAVDLLRRIEQYSPYITLAGLTIQTQPEAPDRHRVTLQLEWPIAVSGGVMDLSTRRSEAP